MWTARVVFAVLLLSGWAFIFIWNSHSFGNYETGTTVVVLKGPGATRHIEKVENPKSSAATQGGTAGESSGERTIQTDEERPKADQYARAKATSEEHPKSFPESLIGDDGLLLLQLGAWLLAAYVGAAIAHRVADGNFRFKIGPLDLSAAASEINSGYVAALGESVQAIGEELENLQDASKQSVTPITVPSPTAYVRRQAEAL